MVPESQFGGRIDGDDEVFQRTRRVFMFLKLLSMSEPWLQYAIRLNLLNESREDLVDLKNEALKDKKIQSYLNDVANFHNAIVRNHKDPD